LLYSTLLYVTFWLTVIAGLTYLFKDRLRSGHRFPPAWRYPVLVILLGRCVDPQKATSDLFQEYGERKGFARYTIDENLLGMVLSLFLVVIVRVGVVGLVWDSSCQSGHPFSSTSNS